MCEIVSAIALVAGTALQLYGQHQAGQTAQKQAAYQKKVAENNAQVAEWQARDALERGEQAETEQRRKTRQLMGNQRSAMATNGFDVNEGVNVDLLGDTQMMGTLDALTIRQNAQREAYGHQANASNLLAQAEMEGYQGKVARQEARINMGTTLLSSVPKFAGLNLFSSSAIVPRTVNGANEKFNVNKSYVNKSRN